MARPAISDLQGQAGLSPNDTLAPAQILDAGSAATLCNWKNGSGDLRGLACLDREREADPRSDPETRRETEKPTDADKKITARLQSR